jgi:hypothetical protein
MDDMKRLFDCARDARIILSGDTGQHASVARGDALRILEQHSDFKSGQLTAIRRQRKAEYRKAVELAAQKRTVEAFAQLERMGAVAEFADGELHDSAAKSYLKALAENKSVLLVAPTWAEIEAVTEKVRAELKSAGRLALEEKAFQVFDSLSWTEAQNGMRGNTVPAWPSIFIVADMVLKKVKRWRWSPWKMTRSKFNTWTVPKHFPIGRRHRLRCGRETEIESGCG